MQTALMVSQILFYFVFSLTIIVLGVLLSITAFQVIKIVKELQKISKNFETTTQKIGSQIEDVITNLRNIPFLSFFLKKTFHSNKDKSSERKSLKE